MGADLKRPDHDWIRGPTDPGFFSRAFSRFRQDSLVQGLVKMDPGSSARTRTDSSGPKREQDRHGTRPTRTNSGQRAVALPLPAEFDLNDWVGVAGWGETRWEVVSQMCFDLRSGLACQAWASSRACSGERWVAPWPE